MPVVSVVILTLDEEINISECLDSCRWCDDIHVLDSGSKDRTREIAEALGARVFLHHFESIGRQRNWAIENLPARHDWIFHLDADERFTPELVSEMLDTLAANPTHAGFQVPNKLMFQGSWLKRSSGYPVYQVRLFHKSRLRFVDYGHGQREQTSGTIGRLRQPYIHYNFSKGLEDWIDKHNRYSTAEAKQILAAATERLRLIDLLNGDRVERRRAAKRLWYRLPLRPWLRGFVTLCLMGGALDGRAGWTYASLLVLYERMIDLKLRWLRSLRDGNSQAHSDSGPK